ncbi:SprT family zinc-dependent metalloprotease [Albimonas sp. CAU 1670]|nr:SprT family zinc-dependent metalloprotease [Albimonas sp. CAU 1670]MDF2231910.1 SprT family zinc-dependent metalloprotease [Albimonas sp. CAU 1670]
MPVEALGLSVRVRRNPRATRFTLSVSRVDGRPQLTLPQRASLAEARAFLERHVGWLEGAVARVPAARVVAAGRALPFRGTSVVLEVRPGRFAPRLEDGRLLVCGPPEGAPGRAKAFLKDEARAALVPAAQAYAARLGRRPAKVTLRDTRSRWGSCSSTGALSFSWRLAMAPPEVLDYVAAHEAAHLVEMNHAPAFWALVERLRPDWRDSRDWLRRHGGDLHRVDFGD